MERHNYQNLVIGILLLLTQIGNAQTNLFFNHDNIQKIYAPKSYTLKKVGSKREFQLLLGKGSANTNKPSQNLIFPVVFSLLLLSVMLLEVAYRSGIFKKRMNQRLEKLVCERTKELKQSNEKLNQTNYELRTLNYMASHDIKEPIRKIYYYLTAIEEELTEELVVEHKGKFQMIAQNVERLYMLIEDFTNYISTSSNHKLPKEVIDLSQILSQLNNTIFFIEKNFNGELIFDKKLPQIKANESAIYVILRNLILNGLKFNESEHPKVEVSASTQGNFTHIVVKDNGIGIDKKYFKQIFQLNRRLHTKTEYVGSGIGLALVQTLVDKLDGTIQLHSEVGKGTTFTIVLPI